MTTKTGALVVTCKTNLCTNERTICVSIRMGVSVDAQVITAVMTPEKFAVALAGHMEQPAEIEVLR